jgi:DNA-binding CsgD family transcriptional regulator
MLSMPRDENNLRPIESVILRMRDEGHESPEIGKRIGKKPGTVDRIVEMIEHKEDVEPSPRQRSGARPLERVILKLRARGETYGEIGNRLGRSGDNVRRVEQMTTYRPKD